MQTPTPTPATKPWFKSKIVLFAAALALVAGGNLLTGFLTGQGVTPEQLATLETFYPQIAGVVKQLQEGANVFSVVGTLMGVLIGIVRVWFSPSVMPQSLPGKK